MLTIDIPGSRCLHLRHLVLDYNGTLAVDGKLAAGVGRRLVSLADVLDIHIITADTFGSVRRAMAGLPCGVRILEAAPQDREKKRFVEDLGAESVAAVGNGLNDGAMLERAALGICVIGREGCCSSTMLGADVVCLSSEDALDLLLQPERLRATLRN